MIDNILTMRLVLAPYDLLPPSIEASLALTLASESGGVVTLAPAPLEGDSPESLREAGAKTPRFLRLLDAWRWSAPLWRAGLLRGRHLDHLPLDEIRAACARLAHDPAAASLRPYARRRLFSDPDAYLDSLSRDLLRGGGDPAMTLPVRAGFERFAARHALILVRGEPRPHSRRLGGRSPTASSPLLRLTIPLLTGEAATSLLALRAMLRPQLDSLRHALASALARAREAGGERLLERQRDAEPDRAACAYAEAFREALPGLLDEASRAGEAVRPAEAAFSASVLAAGSTIRAAARALDRIARRGSTGRKAAELEGEPGLALPGTLALTVRKAPWDASPASGGRLTPH